MTEPCEILTWDTEFFGFRIARIKEHRLEARQLQVMLDWCQEQAVKCLYFLADADDPLTARLVEDAGFRQVDVRMTFERRLQAGEVFPEAATLTIRTHQPDDVPVLQAIARVTYTTTRFYFDTGFPRERCDALYDLWVKQSCEDGYAEQVLVTEVEDKPVGYITCHLCGAQKQEGQIGLVGISPQAQGRGAGQALVERSLTWFAAQGVKRVEVVTQARNIRAQRLYQRCGFVTCSAQLWFHKWFTGR